MGVTLESCLTADPQRVTDGLPRLATLELEPDGHHDGILKLEPEADQFAQLELITGLTSAGSERSEESLYGSVHVLERAFTPRCSHRVTLGILVSTVG